MAEIECDVPCEHCLAVIREKHKSHCPACIRDGRKGETFAVYHSRGGVPLPNGNHAEFKCFDRYCGHHMWLPKPGNEKRRSKPKEHLVSLFELDERNECQMCRTPRSLLEQFGDTLNAHHVVEVRENGKDERRNLWLICGSCHSLIHHERTYRGFYRRLVANEKFSDALATIRAEADGGVS